MGKVYRGKPFSLDSLTRLMISNSSRPSEAMLSEKTNDLKWLNLLMIEAVEVTINNERTRHSV